MQEGEYQGDISILLGRGHQVQVVVLDVDESYFPVHDDRWHLTFVFNLHHHWHEFVDNRHVDVATIVATYQHLQSYTCHLNSLHRNMYCEIIFIRQKFNFVFFESRKIHKFKIPTKYLFTKVIMHTIWNQVSTNTVHCRQTKKFRAHAIKWIHSMTNNANKCCHSYIAVW